MKLLPLRPNGGDWFRVPPPEEMEHIAQGWCWYERGYLVLSQLSDKNGPNYHLSITKYGRHCSTDEAMEVLRMFGMERGEEHVPKRGSLARHFLQPIKEKRA